MTNRHTNQVNNTARQYGDKWNINIAFFYAQNNVRFCLERDNLNNIKTGENWVLAYTTFCFEQSDTYGMLISLKLLSDNLKMKKNRQMFSNWNQTNVSSMQIYGNANAILQIKCLRFKEMELLNIIFQKKRVRTVILSRNHSRK